MELDIKQSLLDLSSDEYESSYIENRDRVVDELRSDFKRYEKILKKSFEKKVVFDDTSQNNPMYGDFLSSMNIQFIPKSFVVTNSQGTLYKGVKFDVILDSIKDKNGSDISWIGVKFLKMYGINYMLRDIVEKKLKYFSMGDYIPVFDKIEIDEQKS